MYAALDERRGSVTCRSVVATALAMLVVAGCSTTVPDGPPGPSSVAPQPFSTPSTVSWPFPPPTQQASTVAPSRLPAGVTVNRADPGSVARSAARVWFGWDTTRDRSPYAAAVRTVPLMTAGCARQLTSSPPAGSPGQEWTDLALVHARAVITEQDVALGSEDRPADTGTSAVRIVTVRQRFVADRPVEERRYVVTVTMSRPSRGGVWAVGDSMATACGVVRR